jgi:hypothetical protein
LSSSRKAVFVAMSTASIWKAVSSGSRSGAAVRSSAARRVRQSRWCWTSLSRTGPGRLSKSGVEAGGAWGRGEGRVHDGFLEGLAGQVRRGQLQVFLGLEQGLHVALAHAEVRGEPADAQAVEAVLVDGGVAYRVSRVA